MKKKIAKVGRIASFIVISSAFTNSADSKEARSNDLYANTGVRLAFLESMQLADICGLLVAAPETRPTLPWDYILSKLEVTSADVATAIETARRDAIVG